MKKKDFYGIYIKYIDEYKLYKSLYDNQKYPAMNTLTDLERKQLAIDLCTELNIEYEEQTPTKSDL